MLKKLKVRMTLLNSAVVLGILICIVTFVFISVRIETTQRCDEELMNHAYMLKRYVGLFEDSSSGANAELSEEYYNFKERLSSTNISYGIWDISDKEYVYVSSYSILPETLSSIRNLIFSSDTKAIVEKTESDGKYFIHLYEYNGLSLRICSTVVASDSGSMRIIQTVQNMDMQESFADTFTDFLLLAILIGVLLSLISGYYIAGNAMKPIQDALNQQKEFIADASHELRTPITIMRTNLDVVKACDDESVESQMEWIESAYKETEHMQNLVDNLLQIAKSDAGHDDLSKQEFFVQKLCLDVKNRFEPIAQKKNITIRYKSTVPNLAITADYKKLSQLLSIVMDNAIKYSLDNQIVELTLRMGDNKHAVIEVTDHGIGIDTKELDNIFKRFYRTDKARSRKEGGTGLGLSIARQIAEAHFGTIEAESKKGKGTKIIITLPL